MTKGVIDDGRDLEFFVAYGPAVSLGRVCLRASMASVIFTPVFPRTILRIIQEQNSFAQKALSTY